MWQMAFIETRARGFGPDEWIREHATVVVRPQDSAQSVRQDVAREYDVAVEDVRLVYWDK